MSPHTQGHQKKRHTSLALIRSCSISLAVGAARSDTSSPAAARLEVGRMKREAAARKEREAVAVPRAVLRETAVRILLLFAVMDRVVLRLLLLLCAERWVRG